MRVKGGPSPGPFREARGGANLFPPRANFPRLASLLAQRAQGKRIMALGEANAFFVGDERAVEKSGRREAKRAEQQHLAERRFHQVRPAHDLGDAEVGIVDHAGELVTGRVVLPPDEEITEIAAGYRALFTEVPVG